jgi:hypothetical protein
MNSQVSMEFAEWLSYHLTDDQLERMYDSSMGALFRLWETDQAAALALLEKVEGRMARVR